MMDLGEEFDTAEAMGEVVDAAQMYLAECDASSLAIIPQRCMPYPIISADSPIPLPYARTQPSHAASQL